MRNSERRRLLRWALLGAIGSARTAHAIDEQKMKSNALIVERFSEALRRRERSHAILRSEGVPLNQNLPVIEAEADVKRRSKEEVARRALCLLVVSMKGAGLDQSAANRLATDYSLAKFLTPSERAFLAAKTPTQRDRIQFSWRYEAAWTLLWALGYVSSLEKPAAVCDVQRAIRTMKGRSKEVFIADARLRPQSEILDQADLIYRYHWAVVNARINGMNAPAGLDSGVVMERHHALNWLIGYMDQDWDDISTDT